MISLNNLPKSISSSKKRLGRGYGSGKGGHTASRGQKGQKSRGKMPLLFEGSKMRKSLIRRTPFLRGKLRNKPSDKKASILSLDKLNHFKSGAVVDLAALVKKGLVETKQAQYGVKLLAGKKFAKKLTVNLFCSATARQQIESAGGKVIDKKLKEPKAEPAVDPKKAAQPTTTRHLAKTVGIKAQKKTVSKKKAKNAKS